MPIDEPDDRPGPPFISTLTPIEPREFEPTFASGELVFGRYEVVRMLGKGGMGIVYLVRDRKNNNAERSLKMILPNQVDERSRKRLQREANALARLNHPHIVNLIDSDFENASHPHIVMEFVKGTPLNEILREGAPMPLDWAARILEQLCDALRQPTDWTRRSSTAISSRITSCCCRAVVSGVSFSKYSISASPRKSRLGVGIPRCGRSMAA